MPVELHIYFGCACRALHANALHKNQNTIWWSSFYYDAREFLYRPSSPSFCFSTDLELCLRSRQDLLFWWSLHGICEYILRSDRLVNLIVFPWLYIVPLRFRNTANRYFWNPHTPLVLSLTHGHSLRHVRTPDIPRSYTRLPFYAVVCPEFTVKVLVLSCSLLGAQRKKW